MSHKILIVDDEADIVSLLRDYFEINIYEVLTSFIYTFLKQLKKERKLCL